MIRYAVPELSKGVYWVGVKDWNRRLFDALIPLPQGTTYNAYLIKAGGKTVLIDTVNPGFEEELVEKIGQLTNLTDLDYLVMNHAEPDHAGSVPYIIRGSKATLITTEKGATMARLYYNVSEERVKRVKDGDIIELGGKTLNFIEAPWLHWPETMFTYLTEDKILFPCDFLGSHTAFGFYDDEVEDVISLAKRYFGEIMMPFRSMGEKALGNIDNLDITTIAPSHGPVYRNPDRILKAYHEWTAGKTKQKAIMM